MSRPVISMKINVTRITKDAMFKGEKGTYLDVACFVNKDGRDQYGNDGFVTQEVSKERREAGEKGPIIGNWKYLDAPKPPDRKPEPRPAPRGLPKPPRDPDLDPDAGPSF